MLKNKTAWVNNVKGVKWNYQNGNYTNSPAIISLLTGTISGINQSGSANKISLSDITTGIGNFFGGSTTTTSTTTTPPNTSASTTTGIVIVVVIVIVALGGMWMLFKS